MPEKSNPTAASAAIESPRDVAAAGHHPVNDLSLPEGASHHAHDGQELPSLDSGLAVLNAEGTVLQMNDELCAWLGGSGKEWQSKCFLDLLRDRCGKCATNLGSLLQSKKPFDEWRLGSHLKLEVARHGGHSFIRLASTLPRLADLEEDAGQVCPDSKPMQRQLLVRLAQAEAQLKLLMEQWPGVIFSQRADFSFRFVSPGIEALTGVSATEWQRKPQLFWQAVHEADVQTLRDHLANARNPNETLALTYRLRHFNSGRIAHVLEHRRLNVTSGGLVLGYEGVWLDVTRQTLAEQRLSSAAWKEALSVLTMGLAHDFGNVMAGIHALTETFLQPGGESGEIQEALDLIKKNSRQASQLVHRIINLHQGRVGERLYHDLNQVVPDLADLIRKIIPRRMEFAVEICPKPLPVLLDAVELRQVVINLVLNAVDAMPPAGRLVLRTDGFSKLPRFDDMAGRVPRLPAVGLSVGDNGRGIAPEVRSQIFEPFFTTKSASKGSGLGLYNARVFADRHKGAVSVESVIEKGSTFSLLLPEADFAEGGPAA
jgi:PAS domain S-box-containing protein